MLRLATIRDADRIQEIYAPYVLETAATFEITPPTVAEMRQRICAISATYPYLVCEREDELVGYAYASQYREREAYRYAAAASVYVARERQSCGIGSELYGALLAILKRQNYATCVASITLPNEKSLRLHEKFGFAQVGVMRGVGFKLGKWHDTMWLDKPLSDYPDHPEPLLTMPEISLEGIL